MANREFAKVSPAFWSSKQARELRKASPLAQLLALYLMTTAHGNWLGLYALPLGYAAHDLGVSVEQMEAAMAAAVACGFARYDYENDVVWMPDYAELQVGKALKGATAEKKGDLKIASVRAQFEAVPESPLKDEFLERYAAAYHLPVADASKPREGLEKQAQALVVQAEVAPVVQEVPAVVEEVAEAETVVEPLTVIDNPYMGTSKPIPSNWQDFLAARREAGHDTTTATSNELLKKLAFIEARLVENVVELATFHGDVNLSKMKVWREQATQANPLDYEAFADFA